MKSIREVQSEYKELSIEELPNFILSYEQDQRSGILALIEKANKSLARYEEEKQRIKKMLSYEEHHSSYSYIAGIDEAGRGPLAGPVVAAAVILKREDPIDYVDDSKKISSKLRERLYEEIIQRSFSYGVGVIGEKRIDEINILQATYEAMKEAVRQLKVTPDLLLNDAVVIPGLMMDQVKIIKGDSKSLSIAAASILAKVTRDRIMEAYDELYPMYGFASNKGYGSNEHIEAIKKYGPCPIHRNSFIKNFLSSTR